MQDVIRMVFLIKDDGHLGPLELHQGGKGMDGIHLLLDDVVLPVGFIHLGAPEDHEAALNLEELVVLLLGTIRRVAGLWCRLLGLALLAKGATDVAIHGSVVLEKMLCLPLVEWVGGICVPYQSVSGVQCTHGAKGW
jgi:hypothetical protein